jgi:hypothetical protein
MIGAGDMKRMKLSKFYNEELVKCRLREAAVMLIAHVGAGDIGGRKDRYLEIANDAFDGAAADIAVAVNTIRD